MYNTLPQLNGDESHAAESIASQRFEVKEAATAETAINNALNSTTPDALVILSGGITQGKNTGTWKSVPWGGAAELGLHTGARTRVIAGTELAKVFPQIPVVANSYNRNDADEPTMASIVARELISRSVEPERVIIEEESFSTITQYVELLKIAKENDWNNIAVMGNEYYQERLNALYDYFPEIVKDKQVADLWHDFKDKGGVLRFISSEPILRALSPKYATYLEKVYEQPYYHEMIASEAKGVQAIKAGTYVYDLQPNTPR